MMQIISSEDMKWIMSEPTATAMVSALALLLNELDIESNIIYMDHHPLPEKKYNKSWFHHDNCSSSEQAYRIFEDKLNRDMRRVAIYGAIGDFSETPLIKKWERDWDTRTLYFYAGTLIQGITQVGRDYA